MRILLLLLVALLAGCSSPDETSEDPEPATEPENEAPPEEQPTQGQGSGGQGAPANQAPTGTLQASVQQGNVPVDVNFTFDGSDPDGDPLSWTLDVDGDGMAESEGTVLPASFAHSYTETGTYTVNFTLSDGALETSYEIVINATEAARAPVNFQTHTFTGTISGLYVGGVGQYATDPEQHTFDVPGVASQIDFHLEWDAQGVDLDFDVYTPSGTEAASAANYNDPVLGDDSSEEVATVTDAAHLSEIGTWSIDILSAGSVESTYTLTVSFTP